MINRIIMGNIVCHYFKTVQFSTDSLLCQGLRMLFLRPSARNSRFRYLVASLYIAVVYQKEQKRTTIFCIYNQHKHRAI